MKWVRALCGLGAAGLLGLVIAGLAPKAALADLVMFRLETPPLVNPAPNDGVRVTAVRFFSAGMQVAEINRRLTQVGGGNRISLALPVTAPPDEVEVDYAVPVDGIPTTYSVPPGAFFFDTPYLLPVSPGGVILGPQPGDPTTDAAFEVSLVSSAVDPTQDQEAPTCDVSNPAPGVIEATVQDAESGLESIEERSSNLVVVVPNFTPGTTNPVVVTGSVVNPARTARLTLRVTDGDDNFTYCKEVLRRERKTRQRRTTIRRIVR